MSSNLDTLTLRARNLARLAREVSLLAQLEAHNHMANASGNPVRMQPLADACNHLDVALTYLAGAGLIKQPSKDAGLELVGYDEDPVHCPACNSRSDFVDAYLVGEFGVQLHTCLNDSCEHVFLASESA